MRFWDGSGISWTIYKQSAPHCRQITTTAPHCSIFTVRMLFPKTNQQRQSTEGQTSYQLTDNLSNEPVSDYGAPALKISAAYSRSAEFCPLPGVAM